MQNVMVNVNHDYGCITEATVYFPESSYPADLPVEGRTDL